MSDRDDFEFDDDSQGSQPSEPHSGDAGVGGHEPDEQGGYGREQAFEETAMRGLAHPSTLGSQAHPGGLWILFITEMWERFSYYGMRALLVLYLVSKMSDPVNPGLGWGREEAGTLYAWYTGLVYLTPLFGGWLADKMLGTHRSMLIGGWIIAGGHFTLALTELAPRGPASTATFMAGLVLIIIGTGFFKPCVSVMVGQLYRSDDPRRDSAFTIFYMGINVGAFLGAIIAGTLGEKVGWHWGFGSAGVGMVLGLFAYSALRPKFLRGIGLPPNDPRNQNLDGIDGDGEVVDRNRPLTRVDWHRIWVIIVLALAVVFFWAAFEQAGSSMNVFAKETTDRNIMGWEFPATWYQSVNPLYIVLFAPVFAWGWMWLDKRHLQPNTPLKFAIGITLLGLGFVFMVFASLRTAPIPVYRVSLDSGGQQSVVYVDGESGQMSPTIPAKALGLIPGDDQVIEPALQEYLHDIVRGEEKGKRLRNVVFARPSYDQATFSVERLTDGVWIQVNGTIDLVGPARAKLNRLAQPGGDEKGDEDDPPAILGLEFTDQNDGTVRVSATIADKKPKKDEAPRTISFEGDLVWVALAADAVVNEAEIIFRYKGVSDVALTIEDANPRFSATFTNGEDDETVVLAVSGDLGDSEIMNGELKRVHANMVEIEGLSDLSYQLTGGRVMYSATLSTGEGSVPISGDAVQSYVLTRIETRPSPGEAILRVAQANAGAEIGSIELMVDRSRKAGPHWLLLAYLLHTWGELCLSPVGLSMVTKLAAPKIRSLMMGVWFLANFAANLIAGYLFAYSQQISESRYFAWLFGDADFYVALVIAPVAVGFLVLIISPILKRMMHGLH